MQVDLFRVWWTGDPPWILAFCHPFSPLGHPVFTDSRGGQTGRSECPRPSANLAGCTSVTPPGFLSTGVSLHGQESQVDCHLRHP